MLYYKTKLLKSSGFLYTIKEEDALLGKTHMIIGVASSLAITAPETAPEFLLAVGLGAAGAAISDIDVETSNIHRNMGKAILLIIAAAAVILGLDIFLKTGIVHKITKDSSILRIAAGCLLFIIVCAFGKEQPHRSFMHSFLALLLLDCALGLIWPKLIAYFTVGFLSHLILDTLNKKKLSLLYPLKGGFCMGLFCADGLANQIFYIAGCIAAGVEMILFALRVL